MLQSITKQIRVDVKNWYNGDASEPELDFFVHAYQITISNQSDEPIKLMRRHWFIFDSCGRQHQVQGEGVVGEQPVLEPGESFTYVSGCHLQSPVGAMHGFYHFQRLIDSMEFQVRIPHFVLSFPPVLN
ncbi:MAG: Co2+/Mg2+ efflux protein ApaG [Bacteroidetes bacterium]|nr:Co2+/Mg2+ efflux protein ApaG [Bacteroidota bacterium]